jgi:hypothetical protein
MYPVSFYESHDVVDLEMMIANISRQEKARLLMEKMEPYPVGEFFDLDLDKFDHMTLVNTIALTEKYDDYYLVGKVITLPLKKHFRITKVAKPDIKPFRLLYGSRVMNAFETFEQVEEAVRKNKRTDRIYQIVSYGKVTHEVVKGIIFEAKDV